MNKTIKNNRKHGLLTQAVLLLYFKQYFSAAQAAVEEMK